MKKGRQKATVEPLYNKVLGITNDFIYPSNSKIYGKEPRYNKIFHMSLLLVHWAN